MTDESGRKIMAEFAALRPKTYIYLTGDNNKNKNKRHPKKFVIRRKLKFENYKHCFEAIQLKKIK